MSPFRIICGAAWAAITVILVAGAFGEFNIGNTGGGVLCVVLAVPSGWYDYRVWTFKARRLWFFL